MKGRPKKNVIPFERYDEVERKNSVRSIAKRFAVSTYEVSMVLRLQGIQLRKPGRPLVTKELEQEITYNILGNE